MRTAEDEKRGNLAGGLGAAQAPNGVQGQRPGGGPGGEAPGSSWVFRIFKAINAFFLYIMDSV